MLIIKNHYSSNKSQTSMAVYKRSFFEVKDQDHHDIVVVFKNDNIWFILKLNSLTNSNPLLVSERRAISSTSNNCRTGRPSGLIKKGTI